jgi:hypothetical protein
MGTQGLELGRTVVELDGLGRKGMEELAEEREESGSTRLEERQGMGDR